MGQWQDPLKSPSFCREGTIIHAEGLLLFWPREGSSANEVSGCSPGTRHRCFLSFPPKPGLSSPPDQACHTEKGCSSFNHVSKIQHSPFFPANKPPSSTTRPRATGQQQQPGRCHRSSSCSSEQLLTIGFAKRAFSEAVTSLGGANSNADSLNLGPSQFTSSGGPSPHLSQTYSSPRGPEAW